jgi:protein-S-isoprenylcysteine O-methyltransferase Ste14
MPSEGSVSLRRTGVLAYGVASYAVGVAALVALILVMLGLVPFAGLVPIESPALATLFNVGMLVVFAVQHSVMARKSFKERWTRVINPAMERSTYLLATGVLLLPMLALWQPIDGVLWSVESGWGRALIQGAALFGWAYLFVASFAISHFELFGLQQVWREFRGQAPLALPFRERWMYRFDRHPIMTGFLLGLWCTPHMTVGHVQWSIGMTLYMAIGVHFEERAMRREWGEAYEDYRRRVPTLVPLPFARRSGLGIGGATAGPSAPRC